MMKTKSVLIKVTYKYIKLKIITDTTYSNVLRTSKLFYYAIKPGRGRVVRILLVLTIPVYKGTPSLLSISGRNEGRKVPRSFGQDNSPFIVTLYNPSFILSQERQIRNSKPRLNRLSLTLLSGSVSVFFTLN